MQRCYRASRSSLTCTSGLCVRIGLSYATDYPACVRTHIAAHTAHALVCSLCYRTRLLANAVEMNAFLCFQPQQVDNLRSIDALEEEISATGVVMIYASKGYFKSKSKRGPPPAPAYTCSTQLVPRPTLYACAYTDCLREANATLEQGKRFCVTVDLVRGGAPLSEVEAECNKKMRNEIFGPPGARRDVIVWHRIKDVCPHPRVSTALPSSRPAGHTLTPTSRVLASHYCHIASNSLTIPHHSQPISSQ